MKGEHFEVMQYSPAGPLAIAEHAAFPFSGYQNGRKSGQIGQWLHVRYQEMKFLLNTDTANDYPTVVPDI